MPALRWGSAWQLPASRPAEAGSLITSCPPQAPPQSHLVPGAVWGGQGSREGSAPAPPWAPHALTATPVSSRHPGTNRVVLLHPLLLLVPRPGRVWDGVGERREKPPEFHLQAPSGNIGDFCSPVTRRDRQ